MDRFRVCHGAGLPQSATISGQVIVTFVIEPDGHVSGPSDAGGTFPDGAVRRCIIRAVAQLSFPRPRPRRWPVRASSDSIGGAAA